MFDIDYEQTARVSILALNSHTLATRARSAEDSIVVHIESGGGGCATDEASRLRSGTIDKPGNEDYWYSL